MEYYPLMEWWPAESRLEIIVGTVLTQNASWTGVEKAIQNMKAAQRMDLDAILDSPDEEIAEIIWSCGYGNLKTRRLKNLLRFIRDDYGSVENLLEVPMERLRTELLAVNGVGRETADSILLYALEMPSYVVDAYTVRVLERHQLLPGKGRYDEIKTAFETALPRDVKIYGHSHAMLVDLCKDYCKKSKPKCETCPLAGWH